MSKSQLKRLKNRCQWEKDLPLTKKNKKERRKVKKRLITQKIKERKEKGEDYSDLLEELPKRGKRSRAFRQEMDGKLKDCHPIVIDCSFEDVQLEKETSSLVSQLS